MLSFHFYRKWISLLLVVTIGIPWQALSVQPVYAMITQPAAPGQAQTPAPSADPSAAALQASLDLLVSQGATAAGLKVTAISSQLTLTQNTQARQAGSGQWTLNTQDAQGQPVTLTGTLEFEDSGERGPNSITANASVKGTLSGGATTLKLDLKSALDRSKESGTQSASLIAALTQGGTTSLTTLTRSMELKTLAYGLTQTVTKTSVNRDGQSSDWVQTLTARDLGKGESEVWLKGDMTLSGSARPTFSLDQHFFQRSENGSLTQYYDRYTMTVEGSVYTLQTPAEARASLDGTSSSTIRLVDANGKLLSIEGGKAPGSPDVSPNGTAIVSGSSSQALLLARLSSILASTNFSLCDDLTSPYGSFAIGVLASLLAMSLFGGELILFDLIVGNIATTLIGIWESQAVANAKTPEEKQRIHQLSLLLQLLVGWGGITSAGGLAGIVGNMMSYLGGAGAGKACNADPYFMAPDKRPSTEDLTVVPLRVLRVVGGLVDPSAAPGASQAVPGATQTFNEYSDRPTIFLGGAAPAGATSIGTWTWDPAQAFGAAASHTSGVVSGPQKHYVIHAADPLTLTADDNIIQYVYMDPKNMPSELLLQFYTGDGDGEHRAYWGLDEIQTGGKPGSAALYPMGAFPPGGGWVRLRIPADTLDLVGKPVNGLLYGSFDGQVWWGPTTTSSRLTDNAPEVLQVQGPQALPQTLPGAEITFKLDAFHQVNLQVLDSKNEVVRTLINNEARPAGYQAVIWDGKDEKGAVVADSAYHYQFTLDGKPEVEGTISISPFVANITAPGRFGVVRGNNLPVIGEAYGTTFQSFKLEYGPGLEPTEWKEIAISTSPVVLPAANRQLANINAGNLANWNTGLDEFKPWKDAGLAGVFTLRLTVTGKDGRTVSDSTPLVVGRLAPQATGGVIASPDGKVRLVVPAMATENPFALLGILPAAELDPAETWKAALPADRTPAGPLYEILPADETFRQPATLEIPYDPNAPADKLGLLLGDGTPGGWRYLGGTVDSAKGVIRVQIASFGGRRALVGAFTANSWGEPQPYQAIPGAFTFDAADAAPLITSSSAPAAFYDDFESTPGEWTALDVFGTGLERVKAADAGLKGSGSVLKITRLAGGARLARVRITPYDAAKYPLISFDYRASADYAPNLLVESNGMWFELTSGTAGRAGTKYYTTVKAEPLQNDDAWHHYQVDVLAALRLYAPDAPNYQIDEVALGQVNQKAYMQTVPVDAAPVGDAYYIDNFVALRPTKEAKLAVELKSPKPGASYTAYSFSLDQNPAADAPASGGGTASSTLSLPGSAADGLWYLHARGLGGGKWSATTSYPVVIDRAAPVIGKPDPAPNGAGAPDFIYVPVSDASSGVDPASLQVTISGKTYGAGAGIRYDSELKALEISPFSLKPVLPPINNGQKVDVSISAADYAGNAPAAPFGWSFTADRPRVRGDQFRALTDGDASSPALSPDASLLAFVASRGGPAKIWLIQASDYGETNKTAHPLNGGKAVESGPAWSPDGKQLAYVSDAGGSTQVWISDASGGGAKAITPLGSTVASPTWSPDGRSLAFVSDGNIAEINTDGSGLRVLTDYPDRPVQGVAWQPNGGLLAVDFKLYQETIELYDPASGQLTPLTQGGAEHDPAWLNGSTLLFAAPAGDGQPDAVWKVNLDGSNQTIIDGSGQPGVGDDQPSASSDGSALAMVSTRGGSRNIWLQATLQISRFEALPSTGVVPGDQLQLYYTLPADAEVTLAVMDPSGKALVPILDKVKQARGTQSASWNGMGTDGKPVPAGDYTVKLSAVIGGGDPIERLATARVLDAANIGKLDLSVNVWANTPSDGSDLHLFVYPAGQRILPAARVDYRPQVEVKLPAGSYDVVATYADLQRVFTGLNVQGQQTTSQTLDLGLGALKVTVLSALGQPITDGSAFFRLIRSGDTSGKTQQFAYGNETTFILAPGFYDVTVEYQNVKKSAYSVEVKSGQVTPQEVNLGSGVLTLNLSSFDGQKSDPNHLVAYAYRPDNHDTAVGTAYYVNPLVMRLPAGTYDVQIRYDLGTSKGTVGGTLVKWLNGVQIEAGAAVTQDINLHLGVAKIHVVEATGKPADNNRLTCYIYPRGQRDQSVANALYIDSASFELAPGSYDILVHYDQSAFEKFAPAAPLEVSEGQTSTVELNMKAARISIEVDDPSGQLTAVDHITARAFLTGKPDATFTSILFTNPVEMVLMSDTQYDIVIQLDFKTQYVLTGQTLKEGDLVKIKVKASDFTPVK